MGYTISINGFHGTNEQAAMNILETKKFKYKYNKEHWLGQGIYFFRDDFDQANSWAIQTTKKVNSNEKKNMKAVVLKTNIEVNNEEYLNLNSREGLFKLKGLMRGIDTKLQEQGYKIDTEIDSESNHLLRCAVLDLIPNEVIKVIQNNFPIEPPGFFKNNIMELINLELHSIQVCIREPNVINPNSIVIKKETDVSRRMFGKKRKQSNVIKYKGKSD